MNDDGLIDNLIDVGDNVRRDFSSFSTNGWQDWNTKWNTRVNMVVYSNHECPLAGMADFRSLLADHKIGWIGFSKVISHYICLSSEYVCKHLHFDSSDFK
jgi:hypothetical protein